jgi:hypothetical protein
VSQKSVANARSAPIARLGLALLAPLARVPRLPRRLVRRLARHYANGGRHDLAIAVIERALAAPRAADAGLLHQLGVSRLATGELDEAVTSLRRAVGLAPDAAWSYQALGQALKAQGRHDEAETALRRAIERQPGDLWAWYHLSDSLFLQGRVGAALDAVIAGCAESPFPNIPFPIQALPADDCTPARISALHGLLERHPHTGALMALLSWMLTARRDSAESAQVMRRMAPLHWRLDDAERAAEPAACKPAAFMVIGQPVAGAGPLFRCLEQHPGFMPHLFRKCHYWSRHFDTGADWYRACLPPLRRGSRLISGDGSTDYFSHPDAPARIAAALPAIKLILFLREPVQRAWVQYQIYRNLGLERRDWGQVVADELAPMPICPLDEDDAAALRGCVSPDGFLWRSIALPFLRRWLALFPREQMLILTHAELALDPSATLQRAMGFVGLADGRIDCAAPINAHSGPPMPPDVERRLRDWFAPHQAALGPFLTGIGVELGAEIGAAPGVAP